GLAFPDWRRAARNLGLVASCGVLAIAFSAPAVFPAVVELRRSTRADPITEKERGVFANHPLRLAGLLIPPAFDAAPAAIGEQQPAAAPYPDYFSQAHAAYADSHLL